MYAAVVVRNRSHAIKKAHVKSAKFAATNCFMKIFKTKSKELVSESMSFFNFEDFSVCVSRRKRKFLTNFIANFDSHLVCCVFIDMARAELKSISIG